MYYNKQGKSLNFSQVANAAMASDMSIENYMDIAGITEMSDDVVAVDILVVRVVLILVVKDSLVLILLKKEHLHLSKEKKKN